MLAGIRVYLRVLIEYNEMGSMFVWSVCISFANQKQNVQQLRFAIIFRWLAVGCFNTFMLNGCFVSTLLIVITMEFSLSECTRVHFSCLFSLLVMA